MDFKPSTVAMAPVFKHDISNAFLDYGFDSDESGELRSVNIKEYECPVCGYFVNSHDLPLLYEIAPSDKLKKPCRFCPSCGQRIDWSDIDLDSSEYDLDGLLEPV